MKLLIKEMAQLKIAEPVLECEDAHGMETTYTQAPEDIQVKEETPDTQPMKELNVGERIRDFTIVEYDNSIEHEMFGTHFLATHEREVR